jgi:hypothetical protein
MKGYKLIARVTKDLKMVDFYLSGGHHASCNPKKSKSTLTSNTYQHLSGRIKNFLKGEYVFFLYARRRGVYCFGQHHSVRAERRGR